METNIITIEQMMKDAKHITSIEIASLVGKPHNDVLKAIRKMESAWVQEHQGNFSQMCHSGVRIVCDSHKVSSPSCAMGEVTSAQI